MSPGSGEAGNTYWDKSKRWNCHSLVMADSHGDFRVLNL
jgi:hypothetical protein